MRQENTSPEQAQPSSDTIVPETTDKGAIPHIAWSDTPTGRRILAETGVEFDTDIIL